MINLLKYILILNVILLQNSIDAENVKPLYSLNIVDCGPGEVGFTDKKVKFIFVQQLIFN